MALARDSEAVSEAMRVVAIWGVSADNRSKNTKIVLVMGILRPGKSALVESITGATGHSGSGVRSGRPSFHQKPST